MARGSSVKASAPGSMMMLGEHAVLYQRRAIVCAINKRIEVSIEARDDQEIHIRSSLGNYSAEIKHLKLEPEGPFNFVISSILHHARQLPGGLPSGLSIDIESEMSHKTGLGSSAAVTVATTAALSCLNTQDCEPYKIYSRGLWSIRDVQGPASGADVAASTLGGMVLYRMVPCMFRPLDATPPITVVYSGSKTPTSEVIQRVGKARHQHPHRYEALFDKIDQSIDEAGSALESNDWETLGKVFNENQQHMELMGVSTGPLSDMVKALQYSPGIYGAKISGSGLGDCVMGIGELENPDVPGDLIPVSVTSEGVRVE